MLPPSKENIVLTGEVTFEKNFSGGDLTPFRKRVGDGTEGISGEKTLGNSFKLCEFLLEGAERVELIPPGEEEMFKGEVTRAEKDTEEVFPGGEDKPDKPKPGGDATLGRGGDTKPVGKDTFTLTRELTLPGEVTLLREVVRFVGVTQLEEVPRPGEATLKGEVKRDGEVTGDIKLPGGEFTGAVLGEFSA